RSAAAQRGHRDDLRTRVQGPSGTTGMFDRPGFGTISLIQSFSTGEIQSYSTGPQPSNPTWQTKSDARGHFHIDDVPPGGYWLSAQTSGGYGAGSSVPVFAGQVTQVQLFLARNIRC